jgi:hypothetical protein
MGLSASEQCAMTAPFDDAAARAEHRLLGMILIDNTLCGELLELSPDDFGEPDHARLFRLMRSMIDHGKPASPMTVLDSLDREQFSKTHDIRGWIAGLCRDAALDPPAAFERYVAAVTEAAAARRQSATRVTSNGVDLDETVEHFEARAPAADNGRSKQTDDEVMTDPSVSLDDFHSYMPMHSYIFAPTGEMWPSASVNSRLPPVDDGSGRKPVAAAAWLDRNKPVEQMTWAPGEPKIIRNRLISLGGRIERDGTACFNLYRPPSLKLGDPRGAGRWIDHLRMIYLDEADHIIAFLAQRVQRPAEKINHAIILGGMPGIGKDTLLEPVKHAVGPWNFADISPKNILGNYNAFVKSVVLRISEARDLGEFDRFAFYEAMKSYCAAPPDVLRVNEKHIREYYVPNVCGVIITTNHKTDGMHLPADDRRHLVCWSNSTKADFTPNYWDRMWAWYADKGIGNVAAYLADYDLSHFNAKAAPPQTRAFWEIVDAGRAPENAELAEIIDTLNKPDVLTISQLTLHADQNFADWLKDRRNSRRIPHRLEDCRYVAVRNPDADDGLWRVAGKRQAIYGKISLSHHERLDAAYQATGTKQ